ncbi:DNA polymerase III subunit alpha [Candidatus Vidania fulgoroideorum]
MKFCNFKNYSEYSIEFGINKIKDLISLNLKENNKFVSIADRNNISGSIELFSNNIKPIIGVEILLKDKSLGEGYITLIVKDKNGYNNLCILLNKAWNNLLKLNSIFISKEDLLNFKKGLFIISGGEYSFGRGIFFDNEISTLKKKINKLSPIGNNLFIEIQRFNKKSIEESEKLIYLSYISNVPVVATHPTLFLKKKDFFICKSKYCIENKIYYKNFNNEISDNQYFYSNSKIAKIFKDIPISIENTILLAKKCNFIFDKKKKFIKFYKKKNFEKKIFLIAKKKKLDKIYLKRLRYELSVIKKKNFSNFFLIVADLIEWAKKKKIGVGPGRGSSSGSLISFLLNITEVDPIKHNLIFERFLNIENNNFPDFDIDFCPKERYKVIKYLRSKYNSVYNIVTFGRYGTKLSIRDSGRILGYNFISINKIANLFIDKKSISENLKKNNLLAKKIERFSNILKIANALEGKIKNLSIHAGGVIISDSDNLLPIFNFKKNLTTTTQFDKYNIENMGFLKFDILGLKTLSIINKIKEFINEDISFKNLNFNDKSVFSLINEADTIGVFQLESYGIRKAIKKIKVDNFQDLVAVIALFRPGPIKLIDEYKKRKFSKKVFYFNDKIKNILEETYGLAIYQEQIIKIIKECTNYNLGEAENIRRSLSKKFNLKNQFLKNIKCEYKSKKNLIFSIVKRFSKYSFNKSHAVSYAYITFCMAFLKKYFFIEFIICSINCSINDEKKIFNFYKDLKKKNIILYPPDINKSDLYLEKKDKLFFPFLAIKGGSEKVSLLIIKERLKRKYDDFYDFFHRIDRKIVTKSFMKSLIYSGCFDLTNPNKNDLISFINNSSLDNKIMNQRRFFPQKKTTNKLFIKNLYKSIGFFIENPLNKFNKEIYRFCKTIGKKYIYGAVTNIKKTSNGYFYILNNFEKFFSRLKVLFLDKIIVFKEQFYSDEIFLIKIKNEKFKFKKILE